MVEKFPVNPFAKVLLCTTSLLAAIAVLPPAIFASVDPTAVYARAFALLAAEPYVEKGFQVREDYWWRALTEKAARLTQNNKNKKQ